MAMVPSCADGLAPYLYRTLLLTGTLVCTYLSAARFMCCDNPMTCVAAVPQDLLLHAEAAAAVANPAVALAGLLLLLLLLLRT
jgi:hypothetical protein